MVNCVAENLPRGILLFQPKEWADMESDYMVFRRMSRNLNRKLSFLLGEMRRKMNRNPLWKI